MSLFLSLSLSVCMCVNADSRTLAPESCVLTRRVVLQNKGRRQHPHAAFAQMNTVGGSRYRGERLVPQCQRMARSTGTSFKEKRRRLASGSVLFSKCLRKSCCVCLDATLSDFEKAVYHVAASIEPGRVATYGTIAQVIKPTEGARAARAVGTALRKNPYWKEGCVPKVPCHRVVAADRTLGGYMGVKDPKSTQLERKRCIMLEEGVPLTRNKRGQWVVVENVAGGGGTSAGQPLLSPAELRAIAATFASASSLSPEGCSTPR